MLSLPLTGVAVAHDIWLLPDRFTLSKGDTLIVRQLLGEELDPAALRTGATVELGVMRDITRRFELINARGSNDLLEQLSSAPTGTEPKPALHETIDVEGLSLVGMEHDYIYHLLPNDTFLEYLEHEGLDSTDFRKHMGSRLEQTEAYARSLKCLVQVGEVTGTDLHKRFLGHKLEILLLQDPYLRDPGDPLDAQILFDGEPLPNKLVLAYSSAEQGEVAKARARTDANGVGRFTLDRAGFWLIRAVHLLPCSEQSDAECALADWESYWASYSFELD